jgi:DNA helicase TIP49 (TBP-interacting protein)
MLLGTPYPQVAERVVKIMRSAEMAGRCILVVDATGVGRPIGVG